MIARFAKGFVAAMVAVVAVTPAKAQPLNELLPNLIASHNKMAVATASQIAAKNRARVALGDWFPLLNVTGQYGYENQVKPAADNVNMDFAEGDLKLTQLLWDFGATNASVKQADLRLEQANLGVVSARQSLSLEAAAAYINVLKAAEVLKYSRQSEENVRRQTGVEEARVKRGAGLSTNVLQAKAQLAGAQSRRVRAEGVLTSALNRYRNVFSAFPEKLAEMSAPRVPVDLLPKTLDDAIIAANESNIQLKMASINEQIKTLDIKKTRAKSFTPKLQAIAEQKWKHDVSGTQGYKSESLGKVEFTMPFNLGFTAVNTLRAAKNDSIVASKSYANSYDAVEEQVRNAWQNLETSRINAGFLANQVNISSEFLRLAKKERKLGKRSLLDVLTGETSLINAQSDSASANADVVLASLQLLSTIGALEPEVFNPPVVMEKTAK